MNTMRLNLRAGVMRITMILCSPVAKDVGVTKSKGRANQIETCDSRETPPCRRHLALLELEQASCARHFGVPPRYARRLEPSRIVRPVQNRLPLFAAARKIAPAAVF